MSSQKNQKTTAVSMKMEYEMEKEKEDVPDSEEQKQVIVSNMRWRFHLRVSETLIRNTFEACNWSTSSVVSLLKNITNIQPQDQ